MRSEIDLALLVVSVVLLTVIAGAHGAIQLLAYNRPEKNGENGEPTPSLAYLLEDPTTNYFALSLARLLALAFVIVASHRFATVHLLSSGDPTPRLFLIVLFAIVVPIVAGKLLALREPVSFSYHGRFIIYPVIYLLKPVVLALVAVLKRLSPALVDTVSFPVMPFKKRIELFGYKDSPDETHEQQLMSSVFEFGDTKVREVMVPRIDMVAIEIHINPAEAVDIIIDSGHSRVPVFDQSIDKIVGVIHTKDLLKKVARNEEFSLNDLRRDPYFVPESKMIDELLSEFKKRKIQIAIVVDEYGGTAGLVTLEDVLEELVGDIQDEFDIDEELVQRLDAGSAICRSRIRIDDLNEQLGLELPEGGADTLGGFLYEIIGRVPRVGERIEHSGLEFKIESVARQRIDKVLIKGIDSLRNEARGGTA